MVWGSRGVFDSILYEEMFKLFTHKVGAIIQYYCLGYSKCGKQKRRSLAMTALEVAFRVQKPLSIWSEHQLVLVSSCSQMDLQSQYVALPRAV